MNNSKVRVAVRVRPLNQREEELNSECVVRVNENQVTLLPLSSCKDKDRKEPHTFTFDNCFWTEDRHDSGQEDVFRHLGDGVLENIWLGYNVCIFAYGQTGSGKTFSMMGTDDQPGITPRICSALFSKEPNDSETIRIEASYFEIYNEEVRDLLRSGKKHKKLKVREDRLLGPYVEELSCHAVQSYKEIKLLLEQGNKQRAIAETKMNEQSSRSHAILTLIVTQTCNDHKSRISRELVSKVSLVDLAGSERSYKSGAQGNQLKESCNINKSLSTLGLVINSLAEISENKRKSQYVNYRDSVLTWLLKNNLGGNSKTIMLATVSPAADNYQETLSTLRYADNAKRIVNQAVVNEDVKSKAIEELQEEIKRLREQLKTEQLKERDMRELKSQLEGKEKLLRELETSWEEKLKKTEAASQEWQENLQKMGVTLNKQDVTFNNQCYLIRIGTELIIHNINDVNKIGSGPSQDIQISGPEAECEHCVIRKTKEGELFLNPINKSKTYVNGYLSETNTPLWHADKIQLGTNVFILHVPKIPRPEYMKKTNELNNQDNILSNHVEISASQKTNEGFTQTIPASNDDFNFTKTKNKSDMFTQISTKSNSHHNNVNVYYTPNHQPEYLEIGVSTQVQDSMVQCSPQYSEASAQTSSNLKISNCFRSTPAPGSHASLFSPGIFCWDKDTDIQGMTEYLQRTFKLGSDLSVFCITHPTEDDWKYEVQKFSSIILCHSFATRAEWTQLEEFLKHCTVRCGKGVTVIIITDVMDSSTEKTTREDWEKWKFSKCELFILAQSAMNSARTYKPAPQRATEKNETLRDSRKPDLPSPINNNGDFNQTREFIKNFSLNDGVLGNQGYERVLLQVFGLLGNGKSSFINSCIFVIGGGEFKNHTKAKVKIGGDTTCRIPYKLTDTITMVDNRGMPKRASHETGEIYAQLGNLLPLNTEVEWCNHFGKNMIRLLKETKAPNYTDFIVPIYVHKVNNRISPLEKESYRNMLETAKKLTGVAPVVLITHKSEGGQSEMRSVFKDMGIAPQKIYTIENYTQDDHQMLREKHEQILKIISEILKDVTFTLTTKRNAISDRMERMEFVLEHFKRSMNEQITQPLPPPKKDSCCIL